MTGRTSVDTSAAHRVWSRGVGAAGATLSTAGRPGAVPGSAILERELAAAVTDLVSARTQARSCLTHLTDGFTRAMHRLEAAEERNTRLLSARAR